MHAHWSPEPYNNALADLGLRIANPYPLDYELNRVAGQPGVRAATYPIPSNGTTTYSIRGLRLF